MLFYQRGHFESEKQGPIFISHFMLSQMIYHKRVMEKHCFTILIDTRQGNRDILQSLGKTHSHTSFRRFHG